MGAWDTGIFDDDSAYDAIEELKNSDLMEYFKSAFNHSIDCEYLEYDECFQTIVSVASMDMMLNGTAYRLDDKSFLEFIKKQSSLNLSAIISKAVKALDTVISEKSELNELWSENKKEYPIWLKNINDLRSRLL